MGRSVEDVSRMCRGVEAASRPCVEPYVEPDVEDVEARAQGAGGARAGSLLCPGRAPAPATEDGR